jgi:hypothetical protein
MATEPAIWPALIDRELAAATTASVRVVIDDLIDPILRDELATRTAMPILPARLARDSILGQRLLRLRARLRPPLLTRLRRIRRRRLRTRPRVSPHLFLQPTDPLLEQLTSSRQPLNRGGQLQNELHTALAPAVIDRLRLRTVHTPRIRRRTRRSWLCTPRLNGYRIREMREHSVPTYSGRSCPVRLRVLIGGEPRDIACRAEPQSGRLVTGARRSRLADASDPRRSTALARGLGPHQPGPCARSSTAGSCERQRTANRPEYPIGYPMAARRTAGQPLKTGRDLPTRVSERTVPAGRLHAHRRARCAGRHQWSVDLTPTVALSGFRGKLSLLFHGTPTCSHATS